MDFELMTEDSGELEIFMNLPEDIKRFGKLKQECITVMGDFGKAIFYQFFAKGVSIRYSIYDVLINTVLKARSSLPALELRIALRNQIRGKWDGIENPSLPENYFSLSFTKHVKTRAMFEAGKTYATCDFHFDYPFLLEMAKDFPVLAEFLENVASEEPTDLSGKAFNCTPEMIEAVRYIEKNPYSHKAQSYVIEWRAKEILIAALEKLSDLNSEKPLFLDSLTIDALHFSKKLIEENVEEGISLDFLCRKTGLNEYKLKKGFRTLFKTSAIEYHIRLKMELAKKLLLETNQPISHIAYTLGYHHPTNFSIEFKRRFKCTPKYFRRYGKLK